MSDAPTAAAQDGDAKPGGHGSLTLYIVGAIGLAIVLALIAPHFAMKFEVGGQVFLRLLQMVVVPLVMASVMSGILGLGDVRKLGRPGATAIVYYMTTTVFAAIPNMKKYEPRGSKPVHKTAAVANFASPPKKIPRQ